MAFRQKFLNNKSKETKFDFLMIFVLTEKEANIVRLQFATFRNPSKKNNPFQ
jgi:hypothetical protein